MKTPPADLSSGQIIAALARSWNLPASRLEYVPLGFGSHHWIASGGDGKEWFITVDDLRAAHLVGIDADSFEQLRNAFATAAALRDIVNLAFVIGPVVGAGSEVLCRVGEHYALSVFPFLDVAPTEYGDFRDPGDRDEALHLIGRLHNATARIPPGRLRQDALEVRDEAALLEALNALDEAWLAGPFNEPARTLLSTNSGAVCSRLRRFAVLRATVYADKSDWVISHGETHASNFVRTRSDDLVMVDWDIVALAPRERDLWNLVNKCTPDWSPYRDVTGVTELSAIATEAYRLHWDLSEIAIYMTWCRAPHERTAEMEIAWEELQTYLTD